MANNYFIHISDLHYRLNWEEDINQVLKAFFIDLEIQIRQLQSKNIYFIFSGDIVQSGEDIELYKSFIKDFDSQLNKLNISKNKRICIPGNHDVSKEYVSAHFIDHNGILIQNLNEKEFNDYISNNSGPLISKFENYENFESQFCDFGVYNHLRGKGWQLDNNTSVYCLNTSLTSSGSFNQINDFGKLSIDTRSIHKWLNQVQGTKKIMIMHHPIEWLCDWAQKELKNILRENFCLVISGHTHSHDIFHKIHTNGSLVESSAPPLFTHKKDLLGYSIIEFSEEGIKKIYYRQWTGKNLFVKGVNFSNNEEGEVIIKNENYNPQESKNLNSSNESEIYFLLSNNLSNALKTFSSQQIVWIDRIASIKQFNSYGAAIKEEEKISTDEIVNGNYNLLIKAPPQFGLTCLTHFLCKEIWIKKNKISIRIDYRNTKIHQIEKIVSSELLLYSQAKENIDTIFLDGWTPTDKDSFKLVSKIQVLFPGKRVIILQTMDENHMSQMGEDNIDGFSNLFLLPLPRTEIRKAINSFNQISPIGDEDQVLKKIISDLEVLNIPRTPLNCFTLLKVLESNFDVSPVNRSELIHSILFILFQLDKIPTYKSKPDLKDCEYILGKFCEEIIKNPLLAIFSRDYFINQLEKFCKERVIELENSLVFDILYNNNIIISKETGFAFRYSYWIYYFAAIRMHHEKEFADYIFSKRNYASFPEIIEFYTGIDRTRKDALEILTRDLEELNDAVSEKVGLSETGNPYRSLNWNPTEEIVIKLNAELGEDVQKSNLPDVVKDQFEDRTYDIAKPSNQTIRAIFEEYSLGLLWQSTKAAARALRNSDYVDPQIKRELLSQITRAWRQICKVVLALSPILAEKGSATFDGTGFFLAGDFGDDANKRWMNVIIEISANIVIWFKNDISSQKIGPLLFDNHQNEKDELKKHLIALLIIDEKQKNWKNTIQTYIDSLHKNSYYLYDVYQWLQTQYTYSYVTDQESKDLRHLIKAALAKHSFGSISKSNRIGDDFLNKRELDNRN